MACLGGKRLKLFSYFLDLQKIHQILQKWNNYTTKKSPRSILMGASHYADMSYYGSVNQSELDIVINFRLVPENDEDMKKFYTASKFRDLIGDYLDKVPDGKWPSWALTSWIHKRVRGNVPAQLAKSLNVLLLTLPGTPIVFYGDEIGMKDVESIEYPNDTNKSPMQWNNKISAGRFVPFQINFSLLIWNFHVDHAVFHFNFI